MYARRELLKVMLGAAAALIATPALAQQVVLVERSSPDRKILLDVVRESVERRLGIKVIFEVTRLAMFGEWAFANLRPRTASGGRIDYRRTLYRDDFYPDQDSDTVDVLMRNDGNGWRIVEEAFLPTDVVWEEWEKKYKLPRELFFVE